MNSSEKKTAWRCSVDVRISHPTLDPIKLARVLNVVPSIAMQPGESKVPHGSCKSAGYLCIDHEIEYPERPDILFSWVEQFAVERETYLRQLLESGHNLNVYVGIHTSVLCLGFKLPPTPTIRRLEIPISIEIFCG